MRKLQLLPRLNRTYEAVTAVGSVITAMIAIVTAAQELRKQLPKRKGAQQQTSSLDLDMLRELALAQTPEPVAKADVERMVREILLELATRQVVAEAAANDGEPRPSH